MTETLLIWKLSHNQKHLLFCRLFKAFAEEQALEDAIYYLGEALRKNVIDLDVFLKVSLLMVVVLCFRKGELKSIRNSDFFGIRVHEPIIGCLAIYIAFTKVMLCRSAKKIYK